MGTLTFGRRTVELSNEDKVFFPRDSVTKGELIAYYHDLADMIVPYLKDRPLVMHRFPDGIDGEGFYHKDTPQYFPEWIHTARVKKEDGTVTHAVCDNAATLVYLANQACVTPHRWLSRTDALDRPDLLVFDLDPSGDDFAPVRDAARALRDLLDDLGLVSFVQTTGSSGLHVVVPLDRSADFDTARAFARDAGAYVAARQSDALTTEQRKSKRRGRVFLDTGRNAYGQTAVAPYAVRAKPGAPVATPLEWDELGDARLHPQRYTIKNVRRRLAQRDDPWAGMRRNGRSLREPARRLERRRQDER